MVEKPFATLTRTTEIVMFKSFLIELQAAGKLGIIGICFGVMFVIPILLGLAAFDSLNLGIAIWLAIMAMTIKSFFVSVPEVTGLVTVNLLTGNLVIYGTGLHLRFPWEQVKEGNYINLRIITQPMQETFPSVNAMMLVKWSFQYAPMIERLATYISADDSTIKEGLGDIGDSILSAKIGALPADECKKQQKNIESSLKEALLGADADIENLYGIKIVKVSLADVDYEDAVQKARASQKTSAILLEMAKQIKLDMPTLSDKEAYDNALVASGQVPKTITEVVGEGANAVAGLFKATFGDRKK